MDRGWSRKVDGLNKLGEAVELRGDLTKTTTRSPRSTMSFECVVLS